MATSHLPAVLLVDDDPNIGQIVSATLGPVATVHIARTLSEARGALTTVAPTVVLLDLRLAQEDGAALVPEIAERLPLAATIILSGSNNLERAIELFRVGIDDYLMKPAPPSC